MFNKRHYDFVAEILKDERRATEAVDPDNLVKDALDSLAWRFADKFAADNSKFDADKFFAATVEGVNRRQRSKPEEVLKHHVTGAIERGEKEAIKEIPAV